MKQLRHDLDFSLAYGSVPSSFEHRVQYALRKTQEEKTMKRPMMATIAIVLILLTFTTAACAAILSRTRDVFGQIYPWEQGALNEGDVAVSGEHFVLGGVRFTLDDAVWTESGLYAVGTMRAADGANVVVIPDDYSLDDPVGYLVHYGTDEDIPDNAPTYRQLAEAAGAKLVQPVCHIENQLSSAFPDIQVTPGVGFYPRADGTILFATEADMSPEALARLRGSECRIRFSIYVRELDANGDPVGDDLTAVWEVALRPEE